MLSIENGTTMRLRYLRVQARNLARNLILERSGGLGRALVKPSGIYIDVTYRCTMRCRTCFRWLSRPREDELGVDEWKEVVAALRRWLGDFYLAMGGGEPLLKPEIEEIVRFAASIRVNTSIITSAYPLDGPMFDRLSSAGLDCLCISLDGVNASTHDAIRGVPGSFERAVEAVERHAGQVRAGMTRTTLSLSTTMMRRNMGEIVDLVRWAEAREVHSVNLQLLLPPSAFPYAAEEDVDYAALASGAPFTELSEKGATNAEIEAAFGELKEMRAAGHLIINNSTRHLEALCEAVKGNLDGTDVTCRVGHMNFFIDPFGNVRLCPLMEPVGSVVRERPERLWNSRAARERRRDIEQCREPCRLAHCNFPNVQLYRSLGRLWQQYSRRALGRAGSG